MGMGMLIECRVQASDFVDRPAKTARSKIFREVASTSGPRDQQYVRPRWPAATRELPVRRSHRGWSATPVTTGLVWIASCCSFGQPSGQNGTNAMPRDGALGQDGIRGPTREVVAFCTQTMSVTSRARNRCRGSRC